MKELEKNENLKYKVETGRPKDELNDTFATAIIDDLIRFDIDFIREDVSILFYLN
jgi:hypothetical protein